LPQINVTSSKLLGCRLALLCSIRRASLPSCVFINAVFECLWQLVEKEINGGNPAIAGNDEISPALISGKSRIEVKSCQAAAEIGMLYTSRTDQVIEIRHAFGMSPKKPIKARFSSAAS
jgi:hypothetical protein